MKDKGRGLYKAEIQGISAKYARVRYVRSGEFDVSEERYRAEGYKPKFDDLLSREEFDTANQPRTTTCSGPGAGVKDRSDEVAVQEGLGERHVRWLALLAFVSQNC